MVWERIHDLRPEILREADCFKENFDGPTAGTVQGVPALTSLLVQLTGA